MPEDPCQANGCYSLSEFQTKFGADEEARLMRAGDEPITLPSALKLRSPWVWKAHMQGELIIIEPPVGTAIYFNVVKGSNIAIPAGTSRKRNMRIQLQKTDGTPCTLEENPTYLKLAEESGRKVRFNAETGEVVSMTSPDGKVVTSSRYEQSTKRFYDDEGNLQAAWSSAEGLMNSYHTDDGHLVMEWYSPENVVAKGSHFIGRNTPYRTVSYLAQKYPDGATVVTITRQQEGLPAHKVVRVEHGNLVTITKGEGEEAVVRTYDRNSMGNGRVEIIESLRKGDGTSNARLKKNTSGGWLTESETEAFNTPQAQTTEYIYGEDAYHVKRIIHPDGSCTDYEYDDEWRVIKEQETWAPGIVKITQRTYQEGGFYDNKLAGETVSYENSKGEVFELSKTTYERTSTPEVERTVTRKRAAGTSQEQVSIVERYGEDTPYYAAGKVKMSQTVAGVQTDYTYEETTEHGALFKKTAITKADDKLVAGQSHKTESYISSRDTTLREEEFIWDGTQWIKLSGATFEYDPEGRRTKTTRDNGRSSMTEWMCCGVLSETDENGIRTGYAYNSALQMIETTRSAVYAGDECVTPETITEYERDAADRVLRQAQFAGVMKTEERTEYDLLGRVVKKTDAMGNVTTTSYSVNGLTSTVTQPNGATLITTRDTAGNVLKQSGTGQREMSYEYAVNGTCTVVTTSSNGAVLSRASTNGFGQTVLQEAPSTRGFIGTHSEYNAKNQLVKQYRDADNANVESMAPTLYEYDAFGNVVKQIVALSDAPTKENSPMVEMGYGAPELIDGEVYSVTSQTQYNAQGEPLTTTTKSLISELSAALESKQMVTDIRGNTTTTWTEYGSGAERISNQQIPTSPLPATARIVDGFTMSSRDTVGIQTSASRRYTTEGLELKQTDGRGNTTTTQSDLLGRTVSVTDAAGNTTKTRYQLDNTQPSLVVNALGYSTFSKYDLRNRKVAEYGTGVQPATFGYNDADNLTKLTTYRAAGKVISTDPSGLEGDTTTWEYDLATGLELKKTYADGKGTVRTYDAYNNLATVTDARGVVATYSYDIPRGLLTGSAFSDDTPAQKFIYNFLGQLTAVQDASGERSISYDHYGQTNEDVQPIAGASYALQEHWDAYGRSTGYALLKDGASQCDASTTYGALGRIQAAGFTHDGTVHQFRYGYLAGSNLLQSLAMPNGVTLTQSYEEKRDLLTGMDYVRDNSLVAQRQYSYDALGRPTTRDTRYPDKAVHHADTFTYNKRSELTGALLGEDAYAYSYDNIGNREIAQEADEDITYDANDLNQYTRISTNGEDFTPEYDADGNQTLVQTSTGIWKVQYNGQNRAIKFESGDGHTVITCGYDYMGRRFEKKVTVDGTVTLHERYIYRGYLQITALDMLHDASLIHSITWDPTQEVATRPLAIQKDGTWYTYGWDLTKNICELYDQEGFIRTIYTYSPYGQVTAEGDATQCIQWSSEMYDADLGLVYYNFRYYDPRDGRWTRREPLNGESEVNLYNFVGNLCASRIDVLGMSYELSSEYCKGIWILINDAYLKSKIKPKDIVQGVGKTVAETLEKYALREFAVGTAMWQLSVAVRGSQAILLYAYAFYVCSCKKEPYNTHGYIIRGEGPLPPTTTEEQLQMQFDDELEKENQRYNEICNKCQTKSDETD